MTIEPPPPPKEGSAPGPQAAGATYLGEQDLPSPPGAVGPETERLRQRWPLWVGIGVVVLVVIGIAVVVAGRGSDTLPDQVGELHRLHTAQLQELDDQLSAIKFGDIRMEVAGYGSGDEVELFLFRYSNLPATAQIEPMLRGAAGGIIGTGGTADFDAESVHTLNGVEYRCIPFTGRLFPDDPSEAKGHVCAWEQDGAVVVIMDPGTAAASEAAADADATHAALA